MGPPLVLFAPLVGRERRLKPMGCKHDGRAWARVASAEGRVVYNSLELSQVLLPDTQASRKATLTLSNNRISEMKNGSFSWLSLLQRLPWPPAAAGGLVAVLDARCRQRSC